MSWLERPKNYRCFLIKSINNQRNSKFLHLNELEFKFTFETDLMDGWNWNES